jgi:glycerol-3-phosphate acyltransferase PlsX
MILGTIRKELTAGPISTVGALLAKPAFDRVRKQLDYEEYGGAPLLGVNGVSIISHGRSGAKAIKNAIRVAVQAADAHMPEMIAQGLQSMGQDVSAPLTTATAGEADGESNTSVS